MYVYLPGLIKLFHFALKMSFHFISKTVRCLWRTLYNHRCSDCYYEGVLISP